MNWNIFLPIITALSGIFAGWCLKELSGYLKMRRADRIKYREALTYLLEIWFYISRSSKLGLYVQRFIIIVTDLFPEIETEDKPVVQLAIQGIFNDFVKPSIENLLSKQIEELNETYEKAIERLSQVDPVLAFKLRGRITSYTQVFEYIKKYIIDIETFVGFDIKNLEQIEKSNEALNTMLKEMFIEDLNVNLLVVAKKTGRKTHKEVKSLTEVTIDKQTQKIDAELTTLINKMRDSGIIPVLNKKNI